MSHNRILLLGATGRTGTAILRHLPTGTDVRAALRRTTDHTRLANSKATVQPCVLSLTDSTSLQRGLMGVTAVVNAMRFREDIAPTKLITVHKQLHAASITANGTPARIITIGGAGSLRLSHNRRFWQHPSFPQATLPRGHAHAKLRDYLENNSTETDWLYLVPPPVYHPSGEEKGQWERYAAASDESFFTAGAISYADFAAATVQAIAIRSHGTYLVSWPL